MRRGRLLGWGVVVLCGALGGAALGFRGAAPASDWQEIAWPFARDAWPAGRAFRCNPAVCGGALEVFIRAKRGLCANCETGVTDDAEVDGIADLDMMADDFAPVAAGAHVALGGMAGRARQYVLRLPDGRSMAAEGYLVSRAKQCDLVIVASRGSGAHSAAAQAAVPALVAAAPTARWIDAQLSGR